MFSMNKKISSPVYLLVRTFSKKKKDSGEALYNKIQLLKKFKNYVNTTDQYRYQPNQHVKEERKDIDVNILNVESVQNVKQDRYNFTPHVLWLTKGKNMERPFTGEYWGTKDMGHYECVVCTTKLFTSNEKFFPPTGMASFWNHYSDSIELLDDIDEINDDQTNLFDKNLAEDNVEKKRVCCSKVQLNQLLWIAQDSKQAHKCKSHLGIMYLDGPPPTFKRYSINSGSLKFIHQEWGFSPQYHNYKKAIVKLEKKIVELKKGPFEKNDVVDKVKFDKKKYYEEHKPMINPKDRSQSEGKVTHNK